VGQAGATIELLEHGGSPGACSLLSRWTDQASRLHPTADGSYSHDGRDGKTAAG
jgi:hypothetical protein